MIKAMIVYGILLEDITGVKEALDTGSFQNLEMHSIGIEQEDSEQYVLCYKSNLSIGEYQSDCSYIARGIDFNTLLAPNEMLLTSNEIRSLFTYLGIKSLTIFPEWMMILTDNEE